MYTVKKINSSNINEIDFTYNDFHSRSFIDYGFEIQPLPFEEIGKYLDAGIITILALYEGRDRFSKAILIYSASPDVIELSVIHCPGNENIIAKKEALIKAFNDEVAGGGQNLVSYPMLGIQGDFVRKISHYGFKFVGQAIVKFKFDNAKSIEIFHKVKSEEIPEGYEIVSWDAKYASDLVFVIKDAFEGMQDAKFDPRFTTTEGCKDIVVKITQGIYGEFLGEQTKLLLQDGKLKGFCMVNLTLPELANIPIVGVSKDCKGKGLGRLLLQNALGSVIDAVMTGVSGAKELNATVDTENHPAIKMYRKFGFKEDANYPQAYRELK